MAFSGAADSPTQLPRGDAGQYLQPIVFPGNDSKLWAPFSGAISGTEIASRSPDELQVAGALLIERNRLWRRLPDVATRLRQFTSQVCRKVGGLLKG